MRLTEAVPTFAFIASSSRLAAPNIASLGSSLGKIEAICVSAANWVSISFKECTAQSALPDNSACSSVLINTPLPPTSTNGFTRFSSPGVDIPTRRACTGAIKSHTS